jgi:hypothetical protein
MPVAINAIRIQNAIDFSGSLTDGYFLKWDSTTAKFILAQVSAGAVSSVAASDSSLTISPTTGSVLASLNVANSNVWTAAQTFSIDDAGTTTVVYPSTIYHSSSGTPSTSFGVGQKFQLESSTTANRDACSIEASWATATDASRKSRVTISAYDTSVREGIRVEANGTNACVSLNGAAIQSTVTLYVPLLNQGATGSSGVIGPGIIIDSTATFDTYWNVEYLRIEDGTSYPVQIGYKHTFPGSGMYFKWNRPLANVDQQEFCIGSNMEVIGYVMMTGLRDRSNSDVILDWAGGFPLNAPIRSGQTLGFYSNGAGQFTRESAATNTVVNAFFVGNRSTGTPAADFGVGQLFMLESTTTVDREAGRVVYEWTTATDASRKARGRLTAYDTAEREAIRWEADGSRAWAGVPAGTSTSFAKLGGIIFDHIANASTSNVDGTEDDLYSDTTLANTLSTNSEKIFAEYGGSWVGHATANRRIKAYFGGTSIFDTGTITISATSAWSMAIRIIRVSSTVVRYMVRFTTGGNSLEAYTSSGEITGLTLSNTNILKITGIASGTGAASADITAALGTIMWFPAA